MALELYDIMAEEHMIWAKRLPNGEINVRVENENNEEVYNETGHHAAWDELVYFGRQDSYEEPGVDAEEEHLEDAVECYQACAPALPMPPSSA